MKLNELQAAFKSRLAEAEALEAKDSLTPAELVHLKTLVTSLKADRATIEEVKEFEGLKTWSKTSNGAGVVLAGSDTPSAEDAEKVASDIATKSWYQKKYGTVDAGADQIAREVYNTQDYPKLAMAKVKDFGKFLRYGEMAIDPALKRLMLLTPAQIMDAASNGVSVKSIKTTMIEGDDTLGGYIAPEEFRNSMIQRLPGLTQVRPMANVITTGRDRVVMPKATGGTSRYPGNVRVTWVDESPLGTEAATNATFGQVAIAIYTAMATSQISKNLLEDSAFDLASYLSDQMSIGFAIDEDEQFLVGTGIGRPLGILNGGTIPDSDVNATVSGAAATLTADGIMKVPYGLSAQYRQANAAFVLNKATVQAVRLLKDGNGRYLFTENNNNTVEAVLKQIAGFAVKESEAMPDIGASTYPILFGDFSGYTVADRVGLGIERYDDSTTAKSNAVVFVARRRLGGAVTEGWKFVSHQCHT